VVLDIRERTSALFHYMGPRRFLESWEYRKCRWNPWAPDGSRFAFLRQGEVWTCAPDGEDARRLTFSMPPGWRWNDLVARGRDAPPWRKASPTFGPHGRYIAYVRYQFDRRRHYRRPGPTDLWVIDRRTGLETRLTRPAAGRIYCLDWLNGEALIFDRVRGGYRAELRTIALGKAD